MEWIILWLGFGIACAVIAGNKGRTVVGWFLLGLLFPLISLIIIASLSSLREPEWVARQHQTRQVEPQKKCPQCAELVKAEARICRFCGHAFSPQKPT